MSQSQVNHPTPERATEETAAAIPSKNVDAEKLKSDIDSILDDIDEVLEAEAVEFVNAFVQKGGQ